MPGPTAWCWARWSGRKWRPPSAACAPAWWSTCRTTWCCASRLNIHRKGATPARAGDLALIPGSMGDFSFVASGLGNADWLWSCSHGAGRSVRRQAVRRMKQESASGTWQCVTLREERRRRRRRPTSRSAPCWKRRSRRTDPIRRAAAAVGDVQGMRQDEGAAAYSGRLRVGISSTSLHTASTSAGCLLKVRYTWPMPLSK